MVDVIFLFFVTLLFGPIMFFIISRYFYKNKNLIKYPVDVIDFIGYCMFIPFFNALLAYYNVIDFIKQNSGYLWFCLVFAVLLSFFWGIHRKNISLVNDWSRPKLGKFNFGGWYHMIFFFIQTFLGFIVMFYLGDNILIWFAVSGYLFTVIYHYFVETKRFKN